MPECARIPSISCRGGRAIPQPLLAERYLPCRSRSSLGPTPCCVSPARPRPRGHCQKFLAAPPRRPRRARLLLLLLRTRSGIRRCRLQRDDRRGNVRRLLDELPTGCPVFRCLPSHCRLPTHENATNGTPPNYPDYPVTASAS